MSEKQQTPISRAITWCDEKIESIQERYTVKNSVRISEVAGFKLYLQSLLEEEKKWAKSLYDEGYDSKDAYIMHDESPYIEYEQKGTFEDYYTKYTTP